MFNDWFAARDIHDECALSKKFSPANKTWLTVFDVFFN